MFDSFSAHQIHFQLFFEVTERGKFPNAKGYGFKGAVDSKFLR